MILSLVINHSSLTWWGVGTQYATNQEYSDDDGCNADLIMDDANPIIEKLLPVSEENDLSMQSIANLEAWLLQEDIDPGYVFEETEGDIDPANYYALGNTDKVEALQHASKHNTYYVIAICVLSCFGTNTSSYVKTNGRIDDLVVALENKYPQFIRIYHAPNGVTYLQKDVIEFIRDWVWDQYDESYKYYVYNSSDLTDWKTYGFDHFEIWYDEEEGVTRSKLSTIPIGDLLYRGNIKCLPNMDMVFEYSICSPSGYPIYGNGVGMGVSSDEQAALRYQYWETGPGPTSSPSEELQHFKVEFNTGDHTEMCLSWTYGAHIDYVISTWKYADIKLYYKDARIWNLIVDSIEDMYGDFYNNQDANYPIMDMKLKPNFPDWQNILLETESDEDSGCYYPVWIPSYPARDSANKIVQGKYYHNSLEIKLCGADTPQNTAQSGIGTDRQYNKYIINHLGKGGITPESED